MHTLHISFIESMGPGTLQNSCCTFYFWLRKQSNVVCFGGGKPSIPVQLVGNTRHPDWKDPHFDIPTGPPFSCSPGWQHSRFCQAFCNQTLGKAVTTPQTFKILPVLKINFVKPWTFRTNTISYIL